MENYHITLDLAAKGDKIFNALTREIPSWWTKMFEGSAQKVGEVFIVHFGDSVFKTIKVTELSPNSRIVWKVKDSLINIPELKNQREWVGTTIVWEIHKIQNFSKLKLTHIGLHPSIGCYNICVEGWKQFTNSLKAYIETGVGMPFLKGKEVLRKI